MTAFLTHILGTDPATLEWPQECTVAGAADILSAVFDPHNSLLTIFGACPEDFDKSHLLLPSPPNDDVPGLCSRLLVFAVAGRNTAWQNRGFIREGTINSYWADGTTVELWTITRGSRARETRATTPVDATLIAGPSLPDHWQCRPAGIADAAEIRALLSNAFGDYPVPADPGAIRYALASGAVHGRLIQRPDGRVMAYAAAEFQPGGGAVEITDCVTATAAQGRGLMTHLVARLQEDLEDVFDDCGAYALSREDQVGMQMVLAHLGWQNTGRLVNHFRVGERWLSADLWCAGPRYSD